LTYSIKKCQKVEPAQPVNFCLVAKASLAFNSLIMKRDHMTTSTQLRLREWKKPDAFFELCGWRPEAGLLFVSNSEAKPQVMQFSPPIFSKSKDKSAPVFPHTLPVEIAEVRLVPPPCRANQAEADALRVEAKKNVKSRRALFNTLASEPTWEMVRLHNDDEILIPESGDDAPLLDLLKQFKNEKRQEYEARKRELEDLLTLIENNLPTAGYARYYANQVTGDFAVDKFLLKQEQLQLKFGSMHRFLEWTIDDARRCDHIRDPYLHAKWAKKNYLNLQQMAEERQQMSIWAGFTNSENLSSNCMSGNSLTFLNFNLIQSPAALEIAATIRFRVTFADGQRIWLTDYHNRQPQNASEREEFSQKIGQPVLTAADEAKLKIKEFKSQMERQTRKDIFERGKPQERLARSLLQMFLQGRSYREVKVRGGKSDLLVFSKDGKFLYETKIWRGIAYFKQGIREIEEYLKGEGDDSELKASFYIIFDATKSHHATKYLKREISTKAVLGKSVNIFVVNVWLPQPSKKR
jgi:hypothetical protein